jgi:hypothetical protein
MTQEEADASPQPSPAEALQAEFGDRFEIWRQRLPDGSHGEWVARPWRTSDHSTDVADHELRAPSITKLRELLAEQPTDRDQR